MKHNILYQITLIAVFAISMLSAKIGKTQDVYVLQFTDTSTYDNSCGRILSTQWSVRNDSCVLYTPFFRKETTGCQDVAYDFKVNQSGSGDAEDLLIIQQMKNSSAWITDTIIYAENHAAVHHVYGAENLCYGDVIRYRVILITDSRSEFWSIMSNDVTLSGSFTTYPEYPEPIGTLPIELTVFDVVCTTSGTKVNWTTASEINNELFTIEKSLNLMDWTVAGNMAGAINSSKEISYEYLDKLNQDGTLTYYRLKQTDTDGKYSHSEIRAVQCNCDFKELELTGAGVSWNNLSLILTTGSTSPATLYIFDISGRQIMSQTISPVAGTNTLETLSLPEAKGIYIATIVQDNKTVSIKISTDISGNTIN
jgi:hypothetical protein